MAAGFFRRTLPSFALLSVILWANSHTAFATETDPYFSRLQAISDSSTKINQFFTRAFQSASDRTNAQNEANRTPSNLAATKVLFLQNMNQALSGAELFGHLERYLTDSPEIDRADTSKQNIFDGADPVTLRLNGLSFLGLWDKTEPTVMFGSIRAGIDKFDHFVSEGFKYFKKIHIQNQSEESVLRLGESWEHGIYGMKSTGVYSNGDVVANYLGLLFYENIFEDLVASHQLQVTRRNGIYWLEFNGQISFDLRRYLDPAIDESLTTSTFHPRLWDYVIVNLEKLCSDLNLFDAPFTESELLERFPKQKFNIDTKQNLFSLCKK